jgi:Fe-S oxidoreductase
MINKQPLMAGTIQLFITWIIDTLYPQVGEAVWSVLEKAGVQVAFPPGQTCCGQPAFNAGMLISVPSRIADIEMTLTIGVHGPNELVVICY